MITNDILDYIRRERPAAAFLGREEMARITAQALAAGRWCPPPEGIDNETTRLEVWGCPLYTVDAASYVGFAPRTQGIPATSTDTPGVPDDTPNTNRARLVDHYTPNGTQPVLVAGVEVVPIYVSRAEERAKRQAQAALRAAREVAVVALDALELDAAAIGAAQTASDIDWWAFGRATIAKQNEAMPRLRALLEEIDQLFNPKPSRGCYIIERRPQRYLGRWNDAGGWFAAGEFPAGAPWRDGRPVNDDTMREEAQSYRQTWPDYAVRVRCPNGELLNEEPDHGNDKQ